MPVPADMLHDHEEVLADLRPHWIFFFGPLLLTAVALGVAIAIPGEIPQAPAGVVFVLAAMVAIPALWLVARLVKWFRISLVVTTDRILLRRGIVSRDISQLRLDRVAEVHCSQGVAERIVGTGRLVIELLDHDVPIVVDDIRRPRSVQRLMAEHLGLTRASTTIAPGPTTWAADPTACTAPTVPGIHVPSPAAFEPTPPSGVTLGGGQGGGPASTTREFLGSGSTVPDFLAPGSSAQGRSVTERLLQLEELRRRGMISEAEFDAKKAELLSLL